MVDLTFCSETMTLFFFSFEGLDLLSLGNLVWVADCVLARDSLSVFLGGSLISSQTLLSLLTSSS